MSPGNNGAFCAIEETAGRYICPRQAAPETVRHAIVAGLTELYSGKPETAQFQL